MIPAVNNDLLTADIENNELPSLDFRMNLIDSNINGKVDGAAELKQSIYNILNTEKYMHVIHSWNFGIETQDLFGEPVTYVCAELQRRIEEALLQDERIFEVGAFSFDTSKRGCVHCTFTAITKFGEIESEKVVNI